MKHSPVLVGIAGGSGSGKTSFAKALMSRFKAIGSSILTQDRYYLDRSHEELQASSINFDHPSALDFEMMQRHLEDLSRGQPVRIPIYDYKTHRRQSLRQEFEPTRLILVDGTLLLQQEGIREVFHMRVFVNTPTELRLERRLKRDVAERGRTPESVVQQFRSTVEPMHQEFVEPSQRHADFVVDNEVCFEQCLEKVSLSIEKFLEPAQSTKKSFSSGLLESTAY